MKMTIRNPSIYLPVILAIVLIAGIYIGFKLAPISIYNNKILPFNTKKYDKINDIINYIEQEYVDSVTRHQLTQDAIIGILRNMDPHSQYIPSSKFDEVNEQLMGNFEGIGVQFRIEKDTIMVIHTIPGGPSEKVGIIAGDRIVNIDDTLVAGVKITNRQTIKKLKGKRGTKVDVGIFRRGIPELIDFTIIRDVIPTYSIDIAYMADDSVGYIKISKFSATTYKEFIKALRKLNDQGMTKLILDLRGNAGGYLQASIQLADEFLKEKQLIVYTVGNNRPKSYSYATRSGNLEDTEIVVLIDEGSASASEIIAGAIQDNDRGLIVGRRSFGKGLVQEQLNLPDGSALRLTVARYYTPTGRCIQRPYDNGTEEYYSDFYERFTNGEISNADSVKFSDSLKFTTPCGKTVYGGGGIMPDVYVPLKTDKKASYFNKLMNNGLIFRYSFTYTDNHRNKLNKYQSFDDFNKNFSISRPFLEEFYKYAENNGVKRDENLDPYYEDKIIILLKAFIGRNLFDDEGFYPIYHQADETFQEALAIFTD